MTLLDSRLPAFVGRMSLCALGALAVMAAVSPASAENANRCARYGADYVAVAGSNGCVRIGGHVRVDMPRGATSSAMGYAPTHSGVQHVAAHMPQQMPPLGPLNNLIELFPR